MPHPRTLSLDGEDWTTYWLLPGEWESRRVWEAEPPEAAGRRIAAVVPGHAQDALRRELPDPYLYQNATEWQWVSERDWIFEKRLAVPDDLAGLRFRLRFEAIDDSAHVFLNGVRVGSHEGRYTPAEWDVTDRLTPGAEAHLLVVVQLRDERLLPPGVDWPKGFIPVGIPESVTVEATGPAWFRTAAAYTNLSEERSEAAVTVVTELAALERTAAVIVAEIMQAGLPIDTIEDAVTVFQSDTSLVQSTILPRVQLWQPNGSGRPTLYQVRLSLFDTRQRLLDRRELEFGVRHVEAVPCEGSPPDAPLSCLVVNGRRTWIRGWSWVPLDVLSGTVDLDRYEQVLRLARDANVNLLRVWGGGGVEKEVFYRLCDRYGIMVWQELPPAGEAPSLTALQEQTEAILARRRWHACLVAWSPASGDADSAALQELREAVAMEDPLRLWMPAPPDPAAAIGGRGLSELAVFYDTLQTPLLDSFGHPAAANRGTFRFFGDEIPEPDRSADPVREAFGAVAEFEDWVRASQLLQALELQCAIEAQRRRGERSAGVIPWHLDEPWPTASGTSSVDYRGMPKPAFSAVKRAYAPFHVSAQLSTFHWDGESHFRAAVWLHNDGPERSLLNVVATIVDLNGRELYQENLAAEAAEDASEQVDDISWRFPAGFASPFLLLLEVIDEEGETIARNAYPHSRAGDEPFAGFLHAPSTSLEAEWREDGLCVKNRGTAPALWVEIRNGREPVEDSHFPLGAGAERTLQVTPGRKTVAVYAWNGESVSVAPRGA
ncbi:MAG: glycoside hydrolase family 2 protein [Armatimonadota bacterium]